MRVGIMGGTFDPVHSGHIFVAERAREQLELDGVMLLPTGDPPHKMAPASKENRLAMVRLATHGKDGLFACALEMEREGITYTVDTLRELHRMNPNTDWYYLIGADTLDVLDSWKSFGEVARLCSFAVNGRAEESASTVRMRELEERYGASFIRLPFHGPDISSTDIRKRICEGRDIEGLVPLPVEQYIREQGLYLCEYSREQVLTMLKAELRPARYRHTLGVAQTACSLAERYGVDPKRAELAGLLHDCTKSLPLEEQRALAREVPDTDAAEMAADRVVHAPASCVMAYRRYGVRDPSILSAIRKHTLGDATLSAMEALIYVADFIEPNREDFPGLRAARESAQRDIFAAARLCAQLTGEHVRNEGAIPHERTLAMLR